MILSRPRLEAALSPESLRPITVLAAPIGYGKTLAAAAAAGRIGPVARLVAAPWHRGDFVGALIESVRARRPDFGRFSQAAGDPTSAAGAERFARDLEHVAEPLAIVVDDAHELDLAAFEPWLATLAPRLPDHVRMLCCTRRAPGFAGGGAATLRAVGVLDESALAFDRGEFEAYLRACRIALDAEQADALFGLTAGWPAAVSLALAGPQSAEGSRRPSIDELVAQAIGSLDPTFRRALERRIVRGREVASGSGIDTHPLVLEALHRDLAARPELQAKLHAEAMDEAERAGRLREAVFHAARAGAHELRGLCERHTDAIAALGDPDGELDSRLATLVRAGGGARLTAIRATFARQQGRAETDVLLAQAAAAAETEGDASLRFELGAIRLERALGREAPIAPSEIDELVALAANLGSAADVRAETIRGWASARSGAFAEALAAAAAVGDGENPQQRHGLGVLRAYCRTALGEIAAARRTLDALLRSLEHDDLLVLQAKTLIWYARLAVLWRDAPAAHETATQAQRLRAGLALDADLGSLYLALGESACAMGDAATARTASRRLHEAAATAWYAADARRIPLSAARFLARASFLEGDDARALAATEHIAAAPATPPGLRRLAAAESAVYRLLVSPEGARERAPIAGPAESSEPPIDFVDAAAVEEAREFEALLAAATSSEGPGGVLALIEPDTARYSALAALGILRGFAARDAAWTEAARDAAASLERRCVPGSPLFSQTTTALAVAPSPPADLTTRDTEVLVLLVDGLSNKEIAQRLGVGTRTVETHVERVLAKLEVTTRSRAIAKALRLGYAAEYAAP